MSTAEVPADERLDLSDFEFDVPCDIKYVFPEAPQKPPRRCEEAAEWIMRVRSHCPGAPAYVRLIGPQCHEKVVAGQTATCSTCGDMTVVVLELVDHLERIKP